MSDANRRTDALRQAIAERILVLDGAMGTAIQALDLTADDFGGAAARGLQRAPRPDAPRRDPRDPRGLPRRRRRHRRDRHLRRHAHRARRVRPAGQGVRDQPRRGAPGARGVRRGVDAATGRASSPARWARGPRPSRSPAASPSTRCAPPTPSRRSASSRAASTCCSSRRSRTRSTSRRRCSASTTPSRGSGRAIPIVLSVSIETMGTMLAGQSIEALYVSVAHRDLLRHRPELRHRPGLHDRSPAHAGGDLALSRSRASRTPGCPTRKGSYNEMPAMLAKKVERFCAEGWVNIIGGCCGTTAEHIRMLAEIAARHRPRQPATVRRTRRLGHRDAGDRRTTRAR